MRSGHSARGEETVVPSRDGGTAWRRAGRRRLPFLAALVLCACTGRLGGGPPGADGGADGSLDADGSGDADRMPDGDVDPGGDGGGDAEADADEPVEPPWVLILDPAEGSWAPNPVVFRFAAGGGIETVAFHADGWPLQDAPIPAAAGSHEYAFSTANRARTVVLTGYDGSDAPVATDEVTFVPLEGEVDCTTWTDIGYVSGDPFDITLVTVQGKPVEIHTANAFWLMYAAASAEGVDIRIISGFRTMAEQQYFWDCYQCCCCNDCNLAARPGYSNHQSGHALDLNTSRGAGVLDWLNGHGGEFGFARTVPSEPWHWEWWGGGPGGGPCPVG